MDGAAARTGIRLARPEQDGRALARLYEPYVRETVISFEEVPPTAEDMADRVRRVLRHYPYLVYEADGEVVGFAYGSEHRARAAYRWSADVSVYVAPAWHRRGVGRALYTALLDLMRRQRFHLAFAGITLPNAGSVGLHERMGFTHVGTYLEVGYKLGAWHDVGWWRLPLDPAAPPTEPIPFPCLPAL
jgi:phosphinothricin acetyltransferase